MSKINFTNTDSTPEEIAKAEQLFNIKSESGEFIDVTDNLEDAMSIADKNPGSSVYSDETNEVVYPLEEDVEVLADIVEEEVEPVVETPVPAVEVEKPQSAKACIQVVAVNEVIKVTEPEVEEVKSNKIIIPGMVVKLENQYLYKSAYIPQPFKKISNTVFIFDGKCINGRYRVTNNVNTCGGDIKNVIGYISETCIK